MSRMHVIVVGCGRVGRELSMALDRDGHTVSVMDKDRNAFHELPKEFTGKAIPVSYTHLTLPTICSV